MINKRIPYFIAEIGINHNGHLETALMMMKRAKEVGFQAVKFQKRDINLVYTQEYLDSPRESPWGHTQREQKEGLEFGKQEYDEIDKYAKELDIDWFASPWDPNSLDFLLEYSPKFIKVPSALNENHEFLELINKKLENTQTMVILSNGMLDEVRSERLCNSFYWLRVFALLQCTSTYPCPEDELNLGVLQKHSGLCRKGLSCHCPTNGTIWAPIARSLGASVFEWHVTIDPKAYGSDQKSSLTFEESKNIIDSVYIADQMIGDGHKKVFNSEIPVAIKLRNLAWVK